MQAFLLLEFLLQLLQREIGLALQPTPQPFPDRRGKLRFAPRTVRNAFGLPRSSLVRDQFSNVTNAYLEPLRDLFLGLLAFFVTLQDPATQVVSIGFRHLHSCRRSFADPYSSIALISILLTNKA